MKTKFNLKEEAVANFELALENAGMQRYNGTEDKPRYWRNKAVRPDEDLFLVYSVTDNMEIIAADDKTQRRIIYINGQLYTRSGCNDNNYQDLAVAIEEQCENAKIDMTFEGEGVDDSLDVDNPIYYCNFEAVIKLTM